MTSLDLIKESTRADSLGLRRPLSSMSRSSRPQSFDWGSHKLGAHDLSDSGSEGGSVSQRESLVQSCLSEMVDDAGMRMVVSGTLGAEEGAWTNAMVYSVASFVLLVAVLGFVLWFIILFGLYHGPAVINSFMQTFWISQGITLLVSSPLILLANIIWATSCAPQFSRACSWIPICGARDEAGAFSRAGVLSGRVQNIALLHAVGATAGLGT